MRQGGDTVDHTDGRKSFGRLMLSQARKVIRSNFEEWLLGIREVEDLWVDCLNLVPLQRALVFLLHVPPPSLASTVIFILVFNLVFWRILLRW